MTERMSTSRDRRPANSPPPFEPMTVVSRVSERSPEWKSHTGLPQARAALAYRRGSWGRQIREVWQFTDGEWSLVETRTKEQQ